MFEDYVVQPDWVILLQSGKIHVAEARRLAVRVVRNLPQALTILETMEREHMEARLQQHVCAVQQELAVQQ